MNNLINEIETVLKIGNENFLRMLEQKNPYYAYSANLAYIGGLLLLLSCLFIFILYWRSIRDFRDKGDEERFQMFKKEQKRNLIQKFSSFGSISLSVIILSIFVIKGMDVYQELGFRNFVEKEKVYFEEIGISVDKGAKELKDLSLKEIKMKYIEQKKALSELLTKKLEQQMEGYALNKEEKNWIEENMKEESENLIGKDINQVKIDFLLGLEKYNEMKAASEEQANAVKEELRALVNVEMKESNKLLQLYHLFKKERKNNCIFADKN